jgi:hypothetical protein
MALFEAKDLVIRTSTLDDEDRGTIQVISFTGTHTHHWPPGSSVQDFVETEIRKARPSACLFDFLGYEYTFGNEIGSPIMAALVYGGSPPTPIAIVAQGLTARSLKSLFAFGNLDKIVGFGFFEDIPRARAFLEQELERRRKPPSSAA